MKNFLLFSLVLFIVFNNLHAQSTVGLVAHWDMNGGTTDVSGNGHTGHGSNIIPTAGRDGTPNTAYYFNGVNSVITAPYMADLNMSEYSICAVVKIDGFYSGLCQANTILARGKLNNPGSYFLYFDDNAYDGNDCYLIDSTKDIFKTTSGGKLATYTDWQYNPQIVKNKWYKVVATWNGIIWRVFVNDTLKSSVTSTGGTMGTSFDSIAIGRHIFDAAYPYSFKGFIDDIRIYNRVLADTEIVNYGDTCGYVLTQPSDVFTTVGTNASFTLSTSITSPTYQWQKDSGTGFNDLTNTGPYAGVHTGTLTVAGVTTTLNSYRFRCIVTNEYSCSDISDVATLHITSQINNEDLDKKIVISPNPVDNVMVLHLIGNSPKYTLQLLNGIGQIVENYNVSYDGFRIDVKELPSGVYILKFSSEDSQHYQRLQVIHK